MKKVLSLTIIYLLALPSVLFARPNAPEVTDEIVWNVQKGQDLNELATRTANYINHMFEKSKAGQDFQKEMLPAAALAGSAVVGFTLKRTSLNQSIFLGVLSVVCFAVTTLFKPGYVRFTYMDAQNRIARLRVNNLPPSQPGRFANAVFYKLVAKDLRRALSQNDTRLARSQLIGLSKKVADQNFIVLSEEILNLSRIFETDDTHVAANQMIKKLESEGL